uniref:T-cell surface glycoprotein CD3 zeta chain n=1 Tax=Amphiprion percula TaxID=161767 RepID=A0A3P8SLX0_AMPPE
MSFWTLVLVGVFMVPRTEALEMYSAELCYILDGFLGLYGLVITGMFIKEKFFRTKVKEENVYSDLGGPGSGGFPLRDPERGRVSSRSSYSQTSEGSCSRFYTCSPENLCGVGSKHLRLLLGLFRIYLRFSEGSKMKVMEVMAHL